MKCWQYVKLLIIHLKPTKVVRIKGKLGQKVKIVRKLETEIPVPWKRQAAQHETKRWLTMLSSYNRWRTCIEEGWGGGESKLWFRKDRWFLFSGKLLLANPHPHSTQITAVTFYGFSFFPVNCFISLNFTWIWLVDRKRLSAELSQPLSTSWESRDDHMFLNQWTPVAVGAGNTAVEAEANIS